jgi:hypothetical protein
MRSIRPFGILTVAAVAAMALVGASSAAATQSTALCNVNESPCAAANGTTSVHLIATNPLLHTSSIDLKCESSLLKASILALGNPQVLHLEELTWIGCKSHGGTSCNVSTVLKGLINILKLSSTDAHWKFIGGNTVWLVECGAFIHCSYGGEPTYLLLSAELPTHTGTLHANTTVTASNDHDSFFCPSTSTWLALYESLSDVWISS